MKFLDAKKNETRLLIERAIRSWGYAAEHNYFWYRYCGGEYESSKPIAAKPAKNIYVHFEKGFGLLTKEDEGNIYSVFSEPLAPMESRGVVLNEYLEYIFTRASAKKAVLDLEKETRHELIKTLSLRLLARAPSRAYSLTSPMVNMKTLDLSLSGRRSRDVRHTRNKFLREHRVQIKDARELSPDDLFGVVDRWKKSRNARGRAACERYYNVIAAGFEGVQLPRAFFADDRLIGFTAGWSIPNSSAYYLGIILHDYSLLPAGVMLYLDALEELKKMPYTHVDLGGGDKAITDFKNQFQPESWYSTYSFSVVHR